MQWQVTYRPDTGKNTQFTSTYDYDLLGHLTHVNIADGRPRDVYFVNDAAGQVLGRTETSASASNPKQAYYYFNGIQIGSNGNNGNDNPDVAQTIQERLNTPPTTPGPFRNGAASGTPYADFDQAYNTINTGNPGGDPGNYTVRAGESLQSIAQQQWGDAILWYMIADANGLTASSQISAGQMLIIPNKVANFHNTASTFRPYDPAQAIGDTQPTTPKPPKKPKCGVFGQILLAIIAIAVAVILPHVAAFFQGFWGGVAAAVAGSVVSQGVGLATGIQSKFSFKGVALAALSAGIGGGVGEVIGKGAIAGSQVVGDVVRGALTSAVTQGVAVATGLQDKFSWASVAAAGVISGVGGAVERGLSGGKGSYAKENVTKQVKQADGTFKTVTVTPKGSWQWNAGAQASVGAQLVGGLAGGIAGAATRSLIEGTNFGDNLIAALPDILGSVIGRAAGDAVAKELTKPGKPINLLEGLGYDEPKPEGGKTGTPKAAANNKKQEAIEEAKIEQQVQLAVDPDVALSDDGVSSGPARTPEQRKQDVERTRKILESSPGLRAAADKLLTIGTPIVVAGRDEKRDYTVLGAGDIPAGEEDLDATLAGTINEYAYFTKGTFDDLGKWLTQWQPGGRQPYLQGDEASLKAFRERIDLETKGNGMMLDANIAALEASDNPILQQGAGVLRDLKNYRWENGGKQAQAAADAATTELIRVALPPADVAIGAYRIITGEGDIGDYLSVGGAAAGPLLGKLGLAAKLGSKGAAVGAETAEVVEEVAEVTAKGAAATAEAGVVASKLGRFGSVGELQHAAFVEYQRLIDQGYDLGKKAWNAGKLKGLNEEQAIGSYMDGFARTRMRSWLAKEGILEGANQLVQVNRRLYNAAKTAYRIPDLRIGDVAFDASLSLKSSMTSQIKDFFSFGKFRGVTVVRPTQVGGSYSIIPK